MEEKRELKKLHDLFQFIIYLLVFTEIVMFIYVPKLSATNNVWYAAQLIIDKLDRMPFFSNLLYSKFLILLITCLVSIGTLSKKKIDLDPKKHIVYPLSVGLLIFFGSILFYNKPGEDILPFTSWADLVYIVATFLGTVLIHTSMDNISKIIHSRLGKDVWNVEGESFMQPTEKVELPYTINIPMKFYYNRRIYKGYINIDPFRAALVIGTPGSGKSFSIINPSIRILVNKGFAICVYDFKHPDQGQIAYYHYVNAKKNGKLKNFKFHVVNLEKLEKSRRINPFKPEYLKSLSDCAETAEAIVESLQKSDAAGSSEKFFTQSAINFLAACIYFISKHENGRYSTLPHLLAFLNRSYEEIFSCLGHYPILESLLSPFQSALSKRAYDQLEGQIGTLKIFISRLNTEETAWVFSGDDVNLKISDPNDPSILVLANSPNAQSITSTIYSTIVNRLIRLVNSRGNLPCQIFADEAPTLHIHRLENLIATARSNKVGVMLGLQEIPQLKQLQGKDTASTITSVIGTVISGSVRNKETLDWLERVFGKKKQIGESLSIDRSKTSVSINERYDPLIPAGKIASLRTGEVVGIVALDHTDRYDGKFKPAMVHCKIDLDMKEIKTEENGYYELPNYYSFDGKKAEILTANFLKIRKEVSQIIDNYSVKA